MTSIDEGRPRHDVVGRRVAAGMLSRGDFTYSVVETSRAATVQAGKDRRDDKRRRSHLREGIVKEGRGRVIADCRILDLSSKGARLQLDKERPLPAFFLLTEAGTSRCFHAKLAWQVGRDAGVRLTPAD